MIKINLALNTDELFSAQREVGTKIMGWEEFQELREPEQELVKSYLRNYSSMLQAYITRTYYCREQLKLWQDQDIVPKEKVKATFAENYKKAFGRKMKCGG